MKTRQEKYLEGKSKVNSIENLKCFLKIRGYEVEEILIEEETLTFFVNFKEFGYVVILGPINVECFKKVY